MAKKKKKTKPSSKDAAWAEAERKCRLNAQTVQMAKDLGMNPRKLIKNIPSRTELWKAPVHEWVRELYYKSKVNSLRKRARKELAAASAPRGGEADGAQAATYKVVERKLPGQEYELFKQVFGRAELARLAKQSVEQEMRRLEQDSDAARSDFADEPSHKAEHCKTQ